MFANIQDWPTSASSSENEDATAETTFLSGGEERRPTFVLQLKESVYDDAFLAPLCARYGNAEERFAPFHFSWLLLLLNFLLQFAMAQKLTKLVSDFESDFQQVLWSDGEAPEDGLCQLADLEFENYYKAADFSLLADPREHPSGVRHAAPHHTHVQCQQPDPELFRDFGWLDVDGDGFWSWADAQKLANQDAKIYRTRYQYEAVQKNVYASLTKVASNVLNSGRFSVNRAAMEQARAVSQQLRESNSSIPRDVFESQVQPFYKMCLLMEPALCGSAAYRGALNQSMFLEPLQRLDFRGPPLAYVFSDPMEGAPGLSHNMEHICEVAVDKICPQWVSNDWLNVRAQFSSLCGEPSKIVKHFPLDPFNSESKVLIVRYAGPDVFRNVVLTSEYATFLALILALWAIAMLAEWHEIVIWWAVLADWLIRSDGHGPCIECQEETVEVKSIPRHFCVMVLTFDLLPRTVIAIWVTSYGTVFLLVACSYQNLIMNSLALTFLITIDEMIYLAFVPGVRKEWIAKCKPLSMTMPRQADWAAKCWGHEFFKIVVVIAYIAVTILEAYYTPYGGYFARAEIYECLCQNAGPYCFSALALGGYESVDQAASVYKAFGFGQS